MPVVKTKFFHKDVMLHGTKYGVLTSHVVKSKFSLPRLNDTEHNCKYIWHFTMIVWIYLTLTSWFIQILWRKEECLNKILLSFFSFNHHYFDTITFFTLLFSLTLFTFFIWIFVSKIAFWFVFTHNNIYFPMYRIQSQLQMSNNNNRSNNMW